MDPAHKSAATAPVPSGFWTFFRQWLRRPLDIAAVVPSSRFLARRIVRALPGGTRRVMELGAGTGIFTRALLAGGVRPEDLLAIEYNPALHDYLSRSLPGVRIIQADARALALSRDVVAFAAEAPVDVVVSGLGLLAMGRSTQRAILDGVFDLMRPGGQLIQFTYGPKVPVAPDVMTALDLVGERVGFTLLNLPPASVYRITRRSPPSAPPHG